MQNSVKKSLRALTVWRLSDRGSLALHDISARWVHVATTYTHTRLCKRHASNIEVVPELQIVSYEQ